MTKNNPGLTDRPSAQWIGPNGNEIMSSADINVESLLEEELATSVRLTFLHLRVSLGGVYTCHGEIPTPAVEGEVVASESSNVTVQSEFQADRLIKTYHILMILY